MVQARPWVIWSIVCASSFVFAQAFPAYDYRVFVRELLGPFWLLLELAYLALMILIIAVIAAELPASGTSTRIRSVTPLRDIAQSKR